MREGQKNYTPSAQVPIEVRPHAEGMQFYFFSCAYPDIVLLALYFIA